MILADKIILLRKRKGWSQEELAEQLGVTRQSVSKWEGAQSVPDIQKIIQMSEIFGVTTDYLLKDEIEDTKTEDKEVINRKESEDNPEELRVLTMNRGIRISQTPQGSGTEDGRCHIVMRTVSDSTSYAQCTQ